MDDDLLHNFSWAGGKIVKFDLIVIVPLLLPFIVYMTNVRHFRRGATANWRPSLGSTMNQWGFKPGMASSRLDASQTYRFNLSKSTLLTVFPLSTIYP